MSTKQSIRHITYKSPAHYKRQRQKGEVITGTISNQVYHQSHIVWYISVQGQDQGQAKERYSALVEIIVNGFQVVGHGGSFVESTPIVRRVVGSTLALAAMYGPLASPSLTVACALQCETPTQYLCCVRSTLVRSSI